ncbi:MAG: hypothetical protein AB1424_08560 [Thermodesulfobacteriota bacterium]
MGNRRGFCFLAVAACLPWGVAVKAADQPNAVYGRGAQEFSLATGSPGELGLLKVLAETFGKQNDAKMANQEKGYFMVDSSTLAAAKKEVPDLKVLFKGDKLLVNTYHALCQPGGATPGAATAAKFIDFVASPQGQKIIQDYGKDRYGEGLYNDAAYARQYDD